MFLLFERSRHGPRHLLLLRAVLEVLGLRQDAVRRKKMLHLGHQVAAGAGGLGFNGADHAYLANWPMAQSPGCLDYSLVFRRVTISMVCRNLAMAWAGRTPRQAVLL